MLNKHKIINNLDEVEEIVAWIKQRIEISTDKYWVESLIHWEKRKKEYEN